MPEKSPTNANDANDPVENDAQRTETEDEQPGVEALFMDAGFEDVEFVADGAAPPPYTQIFVDDDLALVHRGFHDPRDNEHFRDNPFSDDDVGGVVGYHMTISMELARWAVHEARRVLRWGPLNQYFHDDDGNPYYVCGTKSPNHLSGCVDAVTFAVAANDNGLRSHFEKTVGQFCGAATFGAGVCSDISALTAGLLTMHHQVASPQTQVKCKILRISHKIDHSFTVLAYGRSPWIVADPWVAEPYIIPFSDCCFDPEGIDLIEEFEVHRPMKHPFGVPFAAIYDYLPAALANPPTIPNLRVEGLTTDAHVIVDAIRAGYTELGEPAYYEDVLDRRLNEPVFDGNTPNRKAKRKPKRGELKGGMFSFEPKKVWCQVSNVREDLAPEGADFDNYWSEDEPRPRPCCLTHEWGEAVEPDKAPAAPVDD